ncbi:hypothetical protein EV421DRAFT_2016628 [Armillaria borealis]|uniref:Uncharacterized protein n=1 Tax=Armillaria borealis TaxID=47425 RepID=A0AA39JV16_9AGAR|nr:hypothetical protein EV421DRAFT_2016628 [Armillaria borealis]
MTTYLNVLRAGKPYIYDIETVVRPLPVHQNWHLLREAPHHRLHHPPLNILPWWLHRLIWWSPFYLFRPRIWILAAQWFLPRSRSHALGPPQWEYCSKGEDVRSLREPSKTGPKQPPKLKAPTSRARYYRLSNHRKFLAYASLLRHRAESKEEAGVLKGICADILSPSCVSKSFPDDSSGKRLAMKRLRRGLGQSENRAFV